MANGRTQWHYKAPTASSLCLPSLPRSEHLFRKQEPLFRPLGPSCVYHHPSSPWALPVRIPPTASPPSPTHSRCFLGETSDPLREEGLPPVLVQCACSACHRFGGEPVRSKQGHGSDCLSPPSPFAGPVRGGRPPSFCLRVSLACLASTLPTRPRSETVPFAVPVEAPFSLDLV